MIGPNLAVQPVKTHLPRAEEAEDLKYLKYNNSDPNIALSCTCANSPQRCLYINCHYSGEHVRSQSRHDQLNPRQTWLQMDVIKVSTAGNGDGPYCAAWHGLGSVLGPTLCPAVWLAAGSQFAALSYRSSTQCVALLQMSECMKIAFEGSPGEP